MIFDIINKLIDISSARYVIMNSLNDIWQEIIRILSSQLTPTAITTWFSDCEPIEIDDCRLVLHTTTDFKRSIISSRFGDTIKAALSDLFSCDFDLLMAAVESAKELGVKMPVGNLYSSDTFYDAAGRNMRFAKMGVMAVEMEAAGLYCTAAYTGKRALAICSISDNLVTGKELSADERQTTFTNMMKIALEVAVKMAAKK